MAQGKNIYFTLQFYIEYIQRSLVFLEKVWAMNSWEQSDLFLVLFQIIFEQIQTQFIFLKHCIEVIVTNRLDELKPNTLFYFLAFY